MGDYTAPAYENPPAHDTDKCHACSGLDANNVHALQLPQHGQQYAKVVVADAGNTDATWQVDA